MKAASKWLTWLISEQDSDNYDSVQELTGIFAGQGGVDITVGEHTQLNGAVIGSTASADKNTLDTGTLGFSDIENKADYQVEHQSVGISSGGSIGGQFAGNMANGLLTGVNGSGSARSTTQSAVSEGTIIIRDPANQQQDVADLSRDVEHANQTLSPIFDKEKEQNRLREAQLIGEIGGQVADIARTQGDISGLAAAQAKWGPLKENATEKERKEYMAMLRNSDEYKAEMQKYGTGSALQQGIQAATAAVQGLAGGDLAKALAGGSAPYLAEVIHNMTTDPATGKVNTESNLMAHAVLGAVTSAINGNSALAGASGAVMGEYIAQQMYPGIKPEDLTEEQRQTISALGSLAAGLAGGLIGDSNADTLTAAQAGKMAVENNALGSVLAAANANKPGTISQWQADKQAEIEKACSGGTPVSCQTMIAAAGTLLTGPLTSGAALTTGGIGAGANAGIGLLLNGEVNPNDVILGYWTGVFTVGTGLWGTIGVNATSGATSSYLKGDDPLKGGAISGVASGLGYGAGKLVELPLDKVFNPMKPWKDWIWTDVGMGISKPLPVNPVPGMAGNAMSSVGTEIINDRAGKISQGSQEEKNK